MPNTKMVLVFGGAVLGLACTSTRDIGQPSPDAAPGSPTSSGGNPGLGGIGGKGGDGGDELAAGKGGSGLDTGGASGSAGTGANSGAGTGTCGAALGQLFGPDYPWNQRIDRTALDSESPAIISYLQKNHTSSSRFRIDGPSDEPNSTYGIVLLEANASTPHQSFTPTEDFYSPDCDSVAPPVPAGAVIEGENGMECTTDGDCHFIVIDTGECRLFEMWRANKTSTFYGGCLAVWDLRAPYSPTLRGDCCTSADAAGLPIAAHMFTADEVASGAIHHAIRFILPNSLIRSRVYVRPATHSTASTSGSAEAPPYGARLRLKSSFDESRLSAGARIVARALKEYGMILSDGGNITFTAANDRVTAHKWRDVGLSAGDLAGLSWSDFEVPDLGTRYQWDNRCDCARTPISR